MREQIISENFNQQEFAEYLDKCKDNGTNIDNWEFDELINMVEDFKQIKRRTTQNKLHQPQFQESQQISDDNYESDFKNAHQNREEFNTMTKGEENQELLQDYENN